MRCNLTIDQGNSAAKVALWSIDNPSRCLARLHIDTPTAAHQHEQAQQIAHQATSTLLSFIEGYDIDAAIYASVTGYDNPMVDLLRHHITQLIVLDHNVNLPIGIQYRTPRTLGIDRIAAAVGALALPDTEGKDLLIADLGTAITYDRLNAERQYLGGNIAPGINMRLRALHSYTARLPLIQADTAQVPIWGDDTATALLAGAVGGVIAEMHYYRSQMAHHHTVVITGGAAPIITPHLSFNYIYEPDLVSIGLNKILTYNNLQPQTR